jgi:hypothetical protein
MAEKAALGNDETLRAAESRESRKKASDGAHRGAGLIRRVALWPKSDVSLNG